MKRQMQSLADDVAYGLAQELCSRWAVEEPSRSELLDLLVEEVTQEVVNALGTRGLAPRTAEDRRALRLLEADNDLDDLASRTRGAIQGEKTNGSSDSDSDCGEEGSKYQNIESLIKYVESSGGAGGVKLVIMNFND